MAGVCIGHHHIRAQFQTRGQTHTARAPSVNHDLVNLRIHQQGAALILDVLGVHEEVIVEDYLLTNKYLPIEQEVQRLSTQVTDQTGGSVSEDVLRPMLELRPEYIRACFDEIRRRFKSREHFYESALKLDVEKVDRLKDRYLH